MSPAERVERLRLAFRANPRDPRVAVELGIALADDGQIVPAARAFTHALSLDPKHLAAHVALGVLRLSQGDGDGAIETFARAAELAPSDKSVCHGLAKCFEQLGFGELASWYRAPANLSKRPPAKLLKDRAQAYIRAGLLTSAETDINTVRRVRPQDADGALLLGQIRMRQNELGAAITAFREAVKLSPSAAEPWAALGDALAQEGSLDEAEAALRRAIAIRPEFPDACQNLANVLIERGRHDEALALLRDLIRRVPDQPAPHSNLSNLLLLLGRFEDGWAEYEWRRQMPGGAPPRVSLPDWQGERLEGRPLHLIGEQGIGDALMFTSCVPDLAGLDGPVTLHVEPRLVRLMERTFPWLKVSPKLPEPDDGGVALPIGSLPRLLRSNEAAFGRSRPFLVADPDATDEWRARFASLGAKLTVGISWRGGKDRVNRRQRTTRLEAWLPVLQIPGVVTVDLQYGDHEDELREIAARSSVVPYRFHELDPVADFDGFVSQVAALDLVVSVCNTTIHVAGGLGVPTLLIAPSAPSWRWLTGRSDCLWYPSVSLIRQTPGEAWPTVLGRAADAIATRFGERLGLADRQDLPGKLSHQPAQTAGIGVKPVEHAGASAGLSDGDHKVSEIPGTPLATGDQGLRGIRTRAGK